MGGPLRALVRRGLWDPDPPTRGRVGRVAVRALRFLNVLAADVYHQDLSGRAAGLVYSTLLSLVPSLAVAFSVLKAFGVHQQLLPLLAQTFEPLGPARDQVARQVVGFVDNLRVGVLGMLGVAGLFVTVVLLLGKVEDAFNHIWRVHRHRSVGRQFTDYLSVVLVGPVLVFTALGLTAAVESTWAMRRLLAIGPLSTLVVPLGSRVLPLLMLTAAFTFLYLFLPFTRVRVRSALVGGAAAAVLWELAGVGFTTFVARSPSYAAIYSGFAILILFLLWLNYAWLIVLIGAEVAYLHQHPATYATRVLRRTGQHGFREQVALSTAIAVARRHLAGERPWRIGELAAGLRVPPSSVEEVVDDLVRRGILLRAVDPPGVALGRPPERVTAVEVLEAVRGAAAADGTDEVDRAVAAVLSRRAHAVKGALARDTLRALVEAPAGEPAVPSRPPPSGPSPGAPAPPPS